MGGRLASKVSSIKLGKGGVGVVGIENDARRDPAVCVGLDDAEQFTAERLGSPVSARQAESGEDKELATCCNDRRRQIGRAEVSDRPYVRDVDISSVQNPAANDRTAIISDYVIGRNLSDCSPVAYREVGLEALDQLACRVPQLPCRSVKFVKAGKGFVDVGLIE